MTIEELCKEIAKQIGLPQDQHVAALFENNESDEICGWAICNESNKILKKFESIEDLFKYYGKNN